MTLKELQEKNARIRAEREAIKELVKVAKEVEPAQPIISPIEETPHIAEAVEQKSEEIAGDQEIVIEKPEPEKKKKAKKPANREYMVVEQIPEE